MQLARAVVARREAALVAPMSPTPAAPSGPSAPKGQKASMRPRLQVKSAAGPPAEQHPGGLSSNAEGNTERLTATAQVDGVLERARRLSSIPADRDRNRRASNNPFRRGSGLVAKIRRTSAHPTGAHPTMHDLAGEAKPAPKPVRRASVFPGVDAINARRACAPAPASSESTTANGSASAAAPAADAVATKKPGLVRSTTNPNWGYTDHPLLRRGSILDRMLLGEVERLTRNPPRFGPDVFVIHPFNRGKYIFDALIQVLTIYSLVSLPLQFAFGWGPPAGFNLFSVRASHLACARVAPRTRAPRVAPRTRALRTSQLLLSPKELRCMR